jgi:hypothetical protein
MDQWNPSRTSAIQSRSRPMRLLGFSNHGKGALRQEISKCLAVCSTFSRSGWSVVRSCNGRYFEKETATAPPQSSDPEYGESTNLANGPLSSWTIHLGACTDLNLLSRVFQHFILWVCNSVLSSVTCLHSVYLVLPSVPVCSNLNYTTDFLHILYIICLIYTWPAPRTKHKIHPDSIANAG